MGLQKKSSLYLNLMLFCVDKSCWKSVELSSDDDMGYGLFDDAELVEEGQTLHYGKVRT